MRASTSASQRSGQHFRIICPKRNKRVQAQKGEVNKAMAAAKPNAEASAAELLDGMRALDKSMKGRSELDKIKQDQGHIHRTSTENAKHTALRGRLATQVEKERKMSINAASAAMPAFLLPTGAGWGKPDE